VRWIADLATIPAAFSCIATRTDAVAKVRAHGVPFATLVARARIATHSRLAPCDGRL